MKINPYRGDIGQKNRSSILDHFEEDPNTWISIGELATITRCSTNSVRVHCYNLCTIRFLEETKIMIGDRYIQHFKKRF